MGANYAIGHALQPHIGNIEERNGYDDGDRVFVWNEKFYSVNKHGELTGVGGIEGYWVTNCWASNEALEKIVEYVYRYFYNAEIGYAEQKSIDEYMEDNKHDKGLTEEKAVEMLLHQDNMDFKLNYLIYREKESGWGSLSYGNKDVSEHEYLQEVISLLKFKEKVLKKVKPKELRKLIAEYQDLDENANEENLVWMALNNEDVMTELVDRFIESFTNKMLEKKDNN